VNFHNQIIWYQNIDLYDSKDRFVIGNKFYDEIIMVETKIKYCWKAVYHNQMTDDGAASSSAHAELEEPFETSPSTCFLSMKDEKQNTISNK